MPVVTGMKTAATGIAAFFKGSWGAPKFVLDATIEKLPLIGPSDAYTHTA